MIERVQLHRDLLMKCWTTARARDEIKLKHTNRQVSKRSGSEIHFEGLRAEVAVAQFFDQPHLVDFSVQLFGDGGSDMLLYGSRMQVKASTYIPPLLRFDLDGSQAFTAEQATLAYVPRSPQQPDDYWCESFGWVDLVGWISREEFMQRATVMNFGHGERLVVAPPLRPMSHLNPRCCIVMEGKIMDPMELFTALCEPFPIEEIAWRVGPTNERNKKPDEPLRGQPLCYVDARTVMDRLDSVCGADGWQCTYTPGVGTSIVCNIGVRIAGDWIFKADGAGATDMEAEKGTLSDAFKRAAVRWGVGRYLYEVKAPWLDLDARKGIREADHAKLRTLHEEYARKAGWGDESGAIPYRLLLADLKQMPAEARAAFLNINMPLIDRMPVVMRRHLLQHNKEAAA